MVVVVLFQEQSQPVSITRPQIANIDISYVQLKNDEGSKIIVALVYIPTAQPVEIDQEMYEQIMEISPNQEAVIIGDLIYLYQNGETLYHHMLVKTCIRTYRRAHFINSFNPRHVEITFLILYLQPVKI